MTLPNFIVIGAAKCGTTSLVHYLAQHPQVFMSPEKEPRFFAPEFFTKYISGPIRKGTIRNEMEVEEYEGLFEDVTTEKAIGEASTEYIFFPETPKRIKELIPDVKLIAILRNPSDRAFSAYCFQLRDGVEPLSFEHSLHAESKRSKEYWRPGWLYQKAGFYFEQLSRYFDVFEPNQIRVYLYEDLDKRPVETLRDIFNFLDVDQDFIPDLSRKNVSALPKNFVLNRLLSNQSPLISLKPYLPKQLLELLRYVKKRNRKPKPKLSYELKTELTELYKDDILKLQTLIKKDLSHWMLH
ncbi:MAG: sulfotransferase [Cyanobacteria bacterium J06554_1]